MNCNIDNLTLGQIKEISKLTTGGMQTQIDDCPFEIEKNYLIRTVTFTLTGKIKKITRDFLVLQDADWIADTGRFSQSLEDSEKFNEVEPFKNDAIVGRGAIVDATEISKLIRKMK